MTDGELILSAGALLAAGVAASLVAARLRLPALLLFMGLGMAIGSDGTGWIDFDDYSLTRLIGTISLALILFEAGLTTGFPAIRTVLRPAISLAFIGTLATALITGLAAVRLLDLSLLEGLLLGSILASTDGAAVFSLLRSSNLRPKLELTLEGEAGLNDPVAVLLVVTFIELINEPETGLGEVLWLFARELSIGALVGTGLAFAALRAMRRVNQAPEGLHLVTSFATVTVAYGGAAVLHGSGFLAAYVAGLILGGTFFPSQPAVQAFYVGLASVAEIVLFLTLGLLVFPSQLDEVLIQGTLLALIVAFVARPLAAALATSFDRYTAAERLLLGWAGLRGAVPVVLATFPVIAGVPKSVGFFNIVFFVVLLSTLIQGTTLAPLARRLGVTTGEGRPARHVE